ncbi:glutathione synthetase [Candidatus Woesearchaeota archaeon]|nr:glutathione synthetase [Candidatus Woesearchaeota archaeon]
MEHLFAEIIGYAATVVGISLMLPQLTKILKTKKVRDLSWGMLSLYVANCVLWFAYGVMIVSWPVTIANFVCTLIGILQLFLKWKYN